MDWSPIQSAGGQSNGVASMVMATFSSPTPVGHTIIVIVSGIITSPNSLKFTVNDNEGNKYNFVGGSGSVKYGTTNDYQSISIFLCTVTTSGIITVTCNTTAGYLDVSISEWPFTGMMIQVAGQASTSQIPSTPIITGNCHISGNCLNLAAFYQVALNNAPWIAGNNYTAIRNVNYIGGSQIGTLIQYLSNTTINPAISSATISTPTIAGSGSLIGIATYTVSFRIFTPTNYYVAAAGSDLNPGTISKPFASLSKALSVALQGDIVSINGGDLIPLTTTITHTSGITINSYGTGQGTIAETVGPALLVFTDCGNIIIENLIWTGSGISLVFSDGNLYANYLFDSITASNMQGSFIHFGTTGSPTVTVVNNVTYSNNYCSNFSARDIINFAGNNTANSLYTNINILNNTGINFTGTNNSNGCYGVSIENCNGGIASGNYFYNIGSAITSSQSGVLASVGIELLDTFNFIVENNIVDGVHGPIANANAWGYGILIDTGSTNITIMNNIVLNCASAGIGSYSTGIGNIVAFNLIVNCCTALTSGSPGFVNANTLAGISSSWSGQIYNNTVIMQTGSCPGIYIKGGNALICANNLIVVPSGSSCINLSNASNVTLNGNAYLSGIGFLATLGSTNYSSLASWQTATKQETNSFALTSNPCIASSLVPAITPSTTRLAYNYSFAVGSPLLGGGVNLTSLYNIILPATDLLGNAINTTNLSIGAINIVKPPAYNWKFVQAIGNQKAPANKTISEAFANPVTAGNLIAALLVSENSLNPTFSDSASDLYIVAKQQRGAVALAYTKATVSGNLTVTATAATNAYLNLGIGEWNPPPGSIFSLGNTESGSGTANTSLSITSVPTTLPAAVIMGANTSVTIPTITPGSGLTLRLNKPAIGSNAGLFIQDNLIASTSPVPLTTIFGSPDNWDAVAVAFPTILPPYSLIGPTSIQVGVAAQFFLVPTGIPTAIDTITLATTGSGIFSSISLSVTKSLTDIPFTYTPTEPGLVKLTATSTNGLIIGASPFQFGAYVPFTVSGPSSGALGIASVFTLTPVNVTTDTITGTITGGGTVTSQSWSNSLIANTITVTPGSAGTQTLTFISANGAPFYSIVFFVSTITLSPQISKWGGLVIPVTFSTGQSNGYSPIAAVMAVNSNPSLFMNGNQVSLNGPVWANANHEYSGVKDGALVMYYPQCGTVKYCGMMTCGQNYTTALAEWIPGSGGGTSLILGSPVLGSGITSYTINTPGSNLANGTHQMTIPGGTFVSPATALVTVVGGIVTSVVPGCGSWYGMGAGYKGTSITNIAYGNAKFTANISGYVQSVPIISSSNDFISLPQIIITGDGTGATTASFMSGPPAGATITMSLDQGAISVSNGVSAAWTLSSIPNYAGQTEPYFNITPTIPFGGEIGTQMYPYSGSHLLTKNKILGGTGWGNGVALDANGFPISGKPGTSVGTTICFQGNEICTDAAIGTWKIIFNDTQANNSGFTNVNIGSGSSAITNIVRTVSGTLVTITENIQLGANATSNDLLLGFNVIWPTSGTWNISNLRVLAPNNTDTYTINPLDLDDNVVAALSGVGLLRFMDCVFGYSGVSNYVDPSDYPFPSPFTGSNFNFYAKTRYINLINIRALNINPANTSFAYSSPFLYVWQDEVVGGTDPSFNNNKYIDMRLGPNGVNDKGTISIGSGAQQFAAIEFTTATPHGLKTLQLIQLSFSNPIPGTVSIANGSTTLTTSSSTPNIGPGNQITISGDSSKGTYSIVSATGPSSFIITPAFGGITVTNVNCNAVPVVPFSVSGNVAINAPWVVDLAVYVTGPNKFFLYWNIGGSPSGSTLQFINSTLQFAAGSLQVAITVPYGSCSPFEFAASAVARFPGAIFWCNLSGIGSNAFHQFHAQRIAPYLINTNNPIYVELYDEPWNGSLGYQQANVRIKWPQYVPNGTSCFNGFWTANGNALPNGNGVQATMFSTAAAFKTFHDELVSLGISSSRIKCMYNVQSGNATSAAVIGQIIKSYNMPTPGAMVQAPYIDCNQGSTIATAFQPAGYPNAGNWPVWLFNDWMKWYVNFSTYYQSTYTDINSGLVPGIVQGLYEGGIQEILFNTFGGSYLANDCMTDPSWADLIRGFFVSAQLGNPTIANSGAKFGSYFTIWFEPSAQPGAPLWCISEGPNMLTGLGLSNRYFMPQGGPGSTGLVPQGYAAKGNQAPGHLAFQQWNAAIPVGYILSGNTSGFVNNSIIYVVTPVKTTMDTITFSDDLDEGIFTPSNLIFNNSSDPQIFLYTPKSIGTKTITAASINGGIINGSPVSLSISLVTYQLDGPIVGSIGEALGYTFTPSGVITDVITLSDGGDGGIFYPSILVISSSSAVQSVAYVPASSGIKTLTFTSADGTIINGSPITLTID
jgi:hypothetical protein